MRVHVHGELPRKRGSAWCGRRGRGISFPLREREVEGMNQEEDELPGGASVDAVAVDSFQVQASGQEASSGTMLDGVGLGLVTGFLARADSLAVRPASLMCVLFPTFSDYSPAIPGIRSPQAGNPLS